MLPVKRPISVFAADGHWADPYMDYLKENNIISGDSTVNMRPDDYITRAEFAQVTNKAFGYTEKASPDGNAPSAEEVMYGLISYLEY